MTGHSNWGKATEKLKYREECGTDWKLHEAGPQEKKMLQERMVSFNTDH